MTEQPDHKAKRSEILGVVNEAMQALSDDATPEQLDLVMLAGGFNPRAVRSFARVLIQQENAATGKPPSGIDSEVKWALSYLASAVNDLFAAGGSFQGVMIAAQSLPNHVAAAKAKGRHGSSKDSGNGVTCCEDESKP